MELEASGDPTWHQGGPEASCKLHQALQILKWPQVGDKM